MQKFSDSVRKLADKQNTFINNYFMKYFTIKRIFYCGEQ